jgi:hypothetical protein
MPLSLPYSSLNNLLVSLLRANTDSVGLGRKHTVHVLQTEIGSINVCVTY